MAGILAVDSQPGDVGRDINGRLIVSGAPTRQADVSSPVTLGGSEGEQGTVRWMTSGPEALVGKAGQKTAYTRVSFT